MQYRHIHVKGGTAAEWAAHDDVLEAREIAFLLAADGSPTALYIGDGVTAFSGLTPMASGGGGSAQIPWLLKTTTEMNAIVSPTEGMAVWNTTEHQLYVYDGFVWTGILMQG